MGRLIAAGGRGAARVRAGVTLLELILVLGIMALAAVVVAPSLAAWSRGSAGRTVAARVTALVRDAKTEATRKGAPVAIEFDEATGALRAGEATFPLPRGWRVEARTEPAGGAAGVARGSVGFAGAGAGTAAGSPPDRDGGAASARTLMTWSPGGLVSKTAWRVTDGKQAIEVEGDSIDGVRIRQ